MDIFDQNPLTFSESLFDEFIGHFVTLLRTQCDVLVGMAEFFGKLVHYLVDVEAWGGEQNDRGFAADEVFGDFA